MKKAIFIFICLAGIISCKKDIKTTEPAPTTNNVITGNITGSTVQYSQYSEYGNELKTGLNGVTVSLDNDNVTATTDEAGNYTLVGVKPGIYVISLSKPGCVTYKIQQVNFPGNGTLKMGVVEIIETPTHTFQSATASFEKDSVHPSSGSLRLKINIKLNPNSKDLWAAVFTGTNSNMDLSNLRDFPWSYKIPANKSDYSFYTTYPMTGIDTSKVYVKVFAGSARTNYFTEGPNNTMVYQGVGAGLPVVKAK